MPTTTLTTPSSPGRARSVSQPLREGVETDFFSYKPVTSGDPTRSPRSQFVRSLSSSNSGSYGRASGAAMSQGSGMKSRARSGSIVTVTEAGGDEPRDIDDRLGVGLNPNAAWVNGPGAWVIHPILIIGAKLLIDAIPGVSQDISWTIVNLGYMALSFLMFHHVTGMPFETGMTSGGAYDDLTLWEQIDSGAQYTPTKKWLTSVPIGLFLISTHYTKYDPTLFALNFAALVFVLFPKLPVLHRLRFHMDFQASAPTEPTTPATSRPSSPIPRVTRN